MEKIIQFHSGIKIPTTNRHTTSPPYFSAQSDLSDEETKGTLQQDLSPIYKKKSHFSDKQSLAEEAKDKKDLKDFKILSFAQKNFDTDESEPNSPESANFFFYRKLFNEKIICFYK